MFRQKILIYVNTGTYRTVPGPVFLISYMKFRVADPKPLFGSGSDPDPAKSLGSFRIRNTGEIVDLSGVVGQRCEAELPSGARERV
jgi:hypothetical protein